MTRLDRTLGDAHVAARQNLNFFAVDAEVGRMAHPLVQPGRAFVERQLPRPDNDATEAAELMRSHLVERLSDLRFDVGDTSNLTLKDLLGD